MVRAHNKQRGVIGHKGRIERLEAELGASDLIAVWLADIQQIDSPREYFESALGDREGRCPEYQLLKRARERLETARHGSPDVRFEEEIYHWLRRMLFMKTLLWAANTEVDRIVADCRSRLDWSHQIAEILEYFRESDSRSQSVERLSTPMSTASDANVDPRPERDEASARGVEFFAIKVHRAVSEIMVDLRAAGLALDSISRSSFDGHNVLFPSIARAMDETYRAAQVYAEKLQNAQSADRTSSEALEKAAHDRSTVLIRKLVAYANAIVALRFEEKARALEALKPHLSKEAGQRRPSRKSKSDTA